MKAETPTAEKILQEVESAASDKKAEQIIILRVRDVCTIADYFVFCSGQNTRQTLSIAEAVEERLRGLGIKPLHVEGKSGGHWILLDYGYLIVHIFLPEIREFYDLERLWGDAPSVRIEELIKANNRAEPAEN